MRLWSIQFIHHTCHFGMVWTLCEFRGISSYSVLYFEISVLLITCVVDSPYFFHVLICE